MEPINQILKGMKPHPSGTSESSAQTSDLMERREAIRRQIVSFYLACRREQPEPEQVDIEVNLALSDWGEIPTHRIADVAAEARKRAGEFIPSNGLIAKIWREMQANRHEDAQRAIRAENNFRYLAAPPVATPEERAAMAEAARKISESLK